MAMRTAQSVRFLTVNSRREVLLESYPEYGFCVKPASVS